MLPSRRKPTHPGEILSRDFLNPLHLTPRQFADKLGKEWDELKIEAIIQGKENLSEKAAEEFASMLGTTTEFWKHLQNICNQWESIQRSNKKGSLKPWKKAQ